MKTLAPTVEEGKEEGRFVCVHAFVRKKNACEHMYNGHTY